MYAFYFPIEIGIRFNILNKLRMKYSDICGYLFYFPIKIRVRYSILNILRDEIMSYL